MRWCVAGMTDDGKKALGQGEGLEEETANESILCMRWPKYWSISLSIIPPKEIPGLISFRMDWLDLLAVQGTLKSLLQHHSSKTNRQSRFNAGYRMLGAGALG